MRHEAIYTTHPNVASIDDGAGAFDVNGNLVDIDETLVAEEIERLESKKIKLQRLNALKAKLRETDYVALADYDKDKPEVIAQRAEWRAEVRQLEDALGIEG